MVILLIYAPAAFSDPEIVQKVFERLFGDAVKLDPAMVAKVKDGKPGERHYVDRNGDGKPEEVWFIDTAKRHPQAWQPVLVRVIDPDGEMGREPDLNNDLYVADWHADGTVDAVCEYIDRDRDGDVDEMALYSPSNSGDKVMAWWGDDVGDDNLLWYDIGYTYRQHECQYRSHFGGDELFCAFEIGLNDPEWTAQWEDPFLFYDLDRDGVTEEVVRIGGRNETIQNLRWGFDADDDATPDDPRDFDVSITAHAPQSLTFDAGLSDRRTLRGIPTGPFLSYAAARDFIRKTQWADMLLCWDENDLNIDGDNLRDGRFADPQERWESVIAKGNEYFAQVGGPSCGRFNKRYEAATAPKGPIRVYFSPTDQRIHLFGANHAWLEINLDYDNKPEGRYVYEDTDGDGYVDTWRLDVNGDGQPDDTWTANGAPVKEVDYAWSDVCAVMKPLLTSIPEPLFALDFRLGQAAVKLGLDPAAVIASDLDGTNLVEELRLRMLSSNESLRYYLDVVKDYLIATIKPKHAAPDFWKSFDALRAKGDLAGMRQAVETAFDLNDPLPKLADVRAQGLARYAKPRVAWAQDWVPPNIGWESDRCAYRAYWGQFDFFGKKKPCLILPTLTQGSPSYHEEQDWGMDAFHVGKTSGLGGVTLYVNDTPYPVWCPEGKGDIVWSKRLVAQDADKVSVELVGERVGGADHPYTVRFLCTAIAGRKDSPIEVNVEGGAPGDVLALGIGMTKLPQEQFACDQNAGVMASWGVQDPVIGTIGLGVIFPAKRFLRFADLPEEHQVVLTCENGVPIGYRIHGDWLNGRRFPRGPVLANWLNELRAEAGQGN